MFGCDCCCVSSIVYAVGVVTILAKVVSFLIRLFKKGKAPELQEKNYKKDVVYLYQFGGTSTCSSLSPYCIKVEAFLRIHDIPFERRNTTKGRGGNGKLPFIELNGEHIADSQVILRRLSEKHSIKNYENAEVEATSHGIDRLVDAQTAFLIAHFKKPYITSLIAQNDALQSVPDAAKGVVASLGGCFMKGMISKRVNTIIGKFSDQQYEEMLRYDLKQIQTVLGEKKFLTGDKPTIVDCSVFGQLASTYYPLTQSKFHDILRSEEYKSLKEYVERFREEVFGNEFHA